MDPSKIRAQNRAKVVDRILYIAVGGALLSAMFLIWAIWSAHQSNKAIGTLLLEQQLSKWEAGIEAQETKQVK